ncbi:leucine-rich repeat-containing protein 15-like, partial [Contarinia nasturtii]|uniref:leucine-rich repeat-containing protein 15-like n=1 Tax=Contarinia nasturtii TaxID=265458 RepID=UPI0012D4B222
MNAIIPVIIFLTSIECVASINYHQIGDCHYVDSYQSFDGKFNLTFICVETNYENTFFTKDTASTCKRNNYKFYKSAIGVINFKDCDLHQIDSNFFDVYSNVFSLNISNLGLQSLQPDFFKSAKSLTKINASHNYLNEMPTLNQSNKLVDVDFSYNLIKNINANTFTADSNRVEMLNLSHNNITELSVQLFKTMPELKRLYVSQNRIGDLPSFLFHNSKNLVEVDLSNNQIGRIDDLAFFGDSNLDKINLSNNQLTAFNKKIIENHEHLTHLDISHNLIDKLKADTFQNLRNLMHLNLAENPIKAVNNETFLTLVKLEHLNLSKTLLKEIKPRTFLHQINLKTIDLTNNEIQVLNSDIFPDKLEILQTIFVEGNRLHTLNGFTSLIYSKFHGIESKKFKCTFWNVEFQPTTWTELDNTWVKIKCTISDDRQHNAIYTTEVSSVSREYRQIDKNTNEVTTVNYGKTKQLESKHIIGCNGAETSMHIFITTWINSVCLIVAVISLIYFILHRRRMHKIT